MRPPLRTEVRDRQPEATICSGVRPLSFRSHRFRKRLRSALFETDARLVFSQPGYLADQGCAIAAPAQLGKALHRAICGNAGEETACRLRVDQQGRQFVRLRPWIEDRK